MFRLRVIVDDIRRLYRTFPVGVDDVDKPLDNEVTAEAGSKTFSEASPARNPKRILVDQNACSGCRRCELACSMRHVGSFQPELSRVRVLKDDRQGSDIPQVCRQCDTAKCLEVCASGAISRDPETHAIVIDERKCVKCGACARACPFGAIRMRGPSDSPLVCDLCGGNPACVEVCPTSAIRFGRAGDAPAPPRFAQPGKEQPQSPAAVKAPKRGGNAE